MPKPMLTKSCNISFGFLHEVIALEIKGFNTLPAE